MAIAGEDFFFPIGKARDRSGGLSFPFYFYGNVPAPTPPSFFSDEEMFFHSNLSAYTDFFFPK